MSEDHERIWLEPRAPDDRYGHEGRLWCQDKVWPNEPAEGEPTEYVRADLYRALEAERDRLRAERDAEKADAAKWFREYMALSSKAGATASAAHKRAEILAEALRPLATLDFPEIADPYWGDEIALDHITGGTLTVGDARRARAALSPTPER